MELRHLRYFRTVAEELHFGRAAKKLNMAQPPLSKQIMQLEQELGVKLINRTKPKIQLTPAGHEFLSRIHCIFNNVEMAVRETQRIEQGKTGKLIIGFSDFTSYDLLPKVIKEFRPRYPEVELDLRELTSVEQVEALKQEEIQVGFLRTPIDQEGIEIQTLYHENYMVALPEDHHASVEHDIVLSSLQDESFIMFKRKTGPYDDIITLCRSSGFSPNIAFEVTQMQTIINLVASGLGIAIVPESVKFIQRSGVVYRHLRGQTGFYNAVVWRKNENSSLVHNFLSITRGRYFTRDEI
jgi:DNA-binding transcriptional LysR family regulator